MNDQNSIPVWLGEVVDIETLRGDPQVKCCRCLTPEVFYVLTIDKDEKERHYFLCSECTTAFRNEFGWNSQKTEVMRCLVLGKNGS